MVQEGGGFPPTQLRQYYDALHGLKEQEETALAELHASDPERLIARFSHSVDAVAGYPPITEPFHGERSEAWKEAAGGPITSTTSFVATLALSGSHTVEASPELAFDFVDREIFPLRSTGMAGAGRSLRRSMDLLLSDLAGYPIVGELKVAGDSPTYYALVQALMYAAELSSPDQRARIAAHYGLTLPEIGPGIGVYLIGFAAPERGAYRQRSFDASRTIASKLMGDPRISRVLRRIAYLKAAPSLEEGLRFEKSFSFGI